MIRTTHSRHGLAPQRLIPLIRAAIRRCELNLSGLNVVTEAATGAYAVTPVIAAMARAAKVTAVCRQSAYGDIGDARRQTSALAEAAGIADRIDLVSGRPRSALFDADIVTNSGHVRPLDAEAVAQMKPGAVIPLMYEAWELRAGDVDLVACEQRGIVVAGTNERHPSVDVFSYLGALSVRLLHDAGIAVYRSKVLLLCDNPFEPYIEHGLRGLGADLVICESPDRGLSESEGEHLDAILLAMHPQAAPILQRSHADDLARRFPGAMVAQLWGDIDRAAFLAAGVEVWPVQAPTTGHMGILLSALGPEPIVRLQCAGLKVGELLSRSKVQHDGAGFDFAQVVSGSGIA